MKANLFASKIISLCGGGNKSVIDCKLIEVIIAFSYYYFLSTIRACNRFSARCKRTNNKSEDYFFHTANV